MPKKDTGGYQTLKQLVPGISQKDIENLQQLEFELEEIFSNFNVVVCSNCPKGEGNYWPTKEKGCCSLCADTSRSSKIGYFQPRHQQQIKTLCKKYKATKEHGFFSMKDKRCKLPRILRSETCLDYCCVHYLREQASKITAKIRIIKRKNGIIY